MEAEFEMMIEDVRKGRGVVEKMADSPPGPVKKDELGVDEMQVLRRLVTLKRPTIRYINLNCRPERNKKFIERHGDNPFYQIERVEGIKTDSHVGCALSHKRIIMNHDFDKEPLLFIAEDDMITRPEFMFHIPRVIVWANENLGKWTIINLGDVRGDHPKFDNGNDFIASVDFTLNFQFIIVSKMMVDHIRNYNPCIDSAVDVWVAYNVPYKKSVYPILTHQEDGVSDIEGIFKTTPHLDFIHMNMEEALKNTVEAV